MYKMNWEGNTSIEQKMNDYLYILPFIKIPIAVRQWGFLIVEIFCW